MANGPSFPKAFDRGLDEQLFDEHLVNLQVMVIEEISKNVVRYRHQGRTNQTETVFQF